jgi:hypothetical protein
MEYGLSTYKYLATSGGKLNFSLLTMAENGISTVSMRIKNNIDLTGNKLESLEYAEPNLSRIMIITNMNTNGDPHQKCIWSKRGNICDCILIAKRVSALYFKGEEYITLLSK